MNDLELTARFFYTLFPEGATVEPRAFGVRDFASSTYTYTMAGHYTCMSEAIAAAVRLSKHITVPGIYFTINPLKASFLSPLNEMNKTKQAARDEHIAYRNALFIDFDPIRAAGVPSTKDEAVCARDLARKVMAYLSARGWPAPCVCFSGNGYHVYYLVENVPSWLIKPTLATLADLFSTPDVGIDRSVHDDARIARMPGTLNRKGLSTPERPHRIDRVFEVPDSPGRVAQEQLYELVMEGEHARSIAEAEERANRPARRAIKRGEGKIEQFCDQFGLEIASIRHKGE